MRVENALKDAARQGLRGPSSRGEWRTCCPFCIHVEGKADVKFKLHMNPGLGVYHCFRCNSSGKADLWFIDAKAVPVEEDRSSGSLGPPAGFVALRDFAILPRPAVVEPFFAYLEKRKMEQRAVACGAGICPYGLYAGRVIVPHYAPAPVSSVWQGFVARSIYPDAEPKYLYPAGMNRRDTVWSCPNFGNANVRSGALGGGWGGVPKFWVVEGVFDALALAPWGIATFGKNVTDEQIELIVESWKSFGIVVCLDGDAWDECRALQMRFKLHGADDVRWCKLPPGEDPGSLGREVEKYIVE